MTTFNSLVNEVQDAATSGSTKRQLRALTQITDLFLAGSASYSTRQVELFVLHHPLPSDLAGPAL